MNFDLGTSEKYKISDHPYALPNKCVGCGISHNNDGEIRFIDTGQELDFYGVLYICSRCFIEMAESLGFVHPEKFTRVRVALDDKLNYIDILKAENDGLRSAVNILTGHRCDSPIPDSIDLEDEAGGEVEGNDPKSSSGRESESSDIIESDDSPGLPDIRGTSESKPAAKSSSSKQRSVEPDDIEL